MMKTFLKFFVLVSFLSVVYISGCTQWKTSNTLPPQAVQGVLDLTTWNLEDDGPVTLAGEWEFYWDQLLTPEDFSKTALPVRTGFIRLPGAWNGYVVNGEPLTEDGYATYRLRVLLNTPQQLLALKSTWFLTAHVVYINGQMIGSGGMVGTTPEHMRPAYLSYVKGFTADTAQLDIIIQTSNFHRLQGGLSTRIQLGKYEQIQRIRENALTVELFLFGSIAVMGLYHFGLFVLRRKDKAPLYFGLICLLVGIRVFLTGELYLMQLFPGTPWKLFARTVSVTIFFSIPVFAMFVHDLFPQEFSKRVLHLLLLICCLFACSVPFTSVKFQLTIRQPFEGILLGSGFYVIYVLIHAALRKKKGARLFLFGFLIFFLTVINDILYNWLVIQTGFLIPFGLFFFILSQAIVLSRRFSRAFSEIEHLSEALTKERTLFRALIDNIPDYIFVKDTRSRYLLANRKILSEAGAATMDEFVGKTDFDFLPAELAEHYAAGEQEIFVSGHPLLNREEPNQDLATGEREWLLTTKVPFQDNQGKIAGLVGISRDITPLKRLEAELEKHQERLEDLVTARTAELMLINTQLRQEIAERKQIEDSLQRRNQELALLNRVGQMFSSTIALNDVLATVLSELRSVLDIVAASFWVVFPETDELVCQQANGLGSEVVIGWHLPIGQGIVGQAALTGEIINVTDSRMEQRHYKEVDHATGVELRSILSIPFRSKGNVIGVLSLVDTRVGRFTAEELRLVEPIASAAASAIENARLFEEEHRQRQRAESLRQVATILNTSLDQQTVLAKMFEQLRRVLRYDSAGMFLREGDDLVLSEGVAFAQHFLGFRKPLSGKSVESHVFRTRQPLIVTDVRNDPRWDVWDAQHPIRSWIGVPLFVGNKGIGVLTVDNFEVGAYHQDDALLFQSFANQAAIAIENARLFKQAQQEIAERTRAETELRVANTQLQETLEVLKRTQTQLIQSEKMAAVGLLVANVGHEINTPLGAIKASGENILHALTDTLHLLPELFQHLSKSQQQTFFLFVTQALDNHPLLTTRERRALRKILRDELDREQINNAYELADVLVDMVNPEGLAPLLPLLQSEHQTMIIRTAHAFSVLYRSCQNILLAVTNVSKIVFALKSYAHYDRSEEKIEASISEGIEVVLTLYHNQLKHGIEVIRHYDDVPAIFCYPDELNQVWTNLIHNAIQAMQGQGTLEISVRQTFEVLETLRQAQDRLSKVSYLFIQITDSGPGIPDDIKEYIFDPFFTTKPAGEGSGLGLDICQKIVEKHQGKIEFESQPGKTTFSVWLPVQ